MSVALPLFAWYLLLSLLGLVTFPLAFHLLPRLPERGYAFSRALGVLLWSFIFWLLSCLGVLYNNPGGIFSALLLLLGLSVWAWNKEREQLKKWLQANIGLVLMVEVLFLITFVGYVLFRAIGPEITATEKPMELAFINAVMRSDRMPPYDPWLAGYSISYYHFGYVMAGMLAVFTGVPAGIAFNLSISLVFAATALGAFGVVYNLLAASGKTQRSSIYLALLAPLFVLVVSNAEGFLEYLHERGVFWHLNEQGEAVSDFWQHTLDIKDLEDPPNELIESRRHWWWWRASRVVRDYSYPVLQDVAPDQIPPNTVWFNGDAVVEQEVIDEFPAFSFYLADLHPHVLVMPFAMLAIAFAFNHFLDISSEDFNVVGIRYHLSLPRFVLGSVIFGGLAFLNTWDFPLYVGLFASANMLKRVREDGWKWARVGEFLLIGFSFGVAGVLLYFPFYMGFSSQAGGILPNLINPTRGVQMWVMFGTLLLPMFCCLLYFSASRGRRSWINGLLAGIGLALLMWAMSVLLALAIVNLLPQLTFINQAAVHLGDLFLGMYGGHSLGDVLREGWQRRVAALGGLLTLAALLGLSIGSLWPEEDKNDQAAPCVPNFAVLLILFGGLLILFPEFAFLRDQFGTRMNTIFKFYIQAWLLWGCAAAYASALLLSETKKPVWAFFYAPVFAMAVGIGLFYPVYTAAGKWDQFRSNPDALLQLDGTQHNWYLSADDQEAVKWLQSAPLGTLVEAVGGSFTHYARISAHSGQPALLGWPGHENQWRGGGEEMGSRQSDIQQLYTTASWAEARLILARYDIRYVYVGALERSTYPVSIDKFEEYLSPVFRSDDVVIYQVPAGIKP